MQATMYIGAVMANSVFHDNMREAGRLVHLLSKEQLPSWVHRCKQ